MSLAAPLQEVPEVVHVAAADVVAVSAASPSVCEMLSSFLCQPKRRGRQLFMGMNSTKHCMFWLQCTKLLRIKNLIDNFKPAVSRPDSKESTPCRSEYILANIYRYYCSYILVDRVRTCVESHVLGILIIPCPVMSYTIILQPVTMLLLSA